MAFKKTYLILCLLFAGMLSLQFQCRKGFACAENRYGFEMGSWPEKDDN